MHSYTQRQEWRDSLRKLVSRLEDAEKSDTMTRQGREDGLFDFVEPTPALTELSTVAAIINVADQYRESLIAEALSEPASDRQVAQAAAISHPAIARRRTRLTDPKQPH